MLQNYRYFLTLAEELNISHAAEKLFISHQCLSRYLKTLEDECGLQLFERKPSLSLTYAGKLLRESLRQIQQTENNLLKQFNELKAGDSGEIRFGITEGRLRIILPDLLDSFGKIYPDVMVKVVSEPSPQMLKKLWDNELDLVFAGASEIPNPNFVYRHMLEEHLYLTVSDKLLKDYFGDSHIEKKKHFSTHGIDLREIKDIPFVLNYKGFNSRDMLDKLLAQMELQLNIIYEATQPDVLHLLVAKDYAASTCLTMYLPSVWDLNNNNPPNNQMNIYPIVGLTELNRVALIHVKGKYMPQYMEVFCETMKNQCRHFNDIPY